MSSGPCTVTGGGACFRSANYPNSYGPNEHCAITVFGAGFVRATTFETGALWPGSDGVTSDDHVTINGMQYAGGGQGLATVGVSVRDGETIAWQSDFHDRGQQGFEICGFDACGQHGSSGGGNACVCIGGYSGAQCEVRPPTYTKVSAVPSCT